MKDDKKKVGEQEVQEETKEKKDNRSFKEKLEDGIDDTMGAVEDFFYGDELSRDFQKDIPATRKIDSGRVVVNKVQTKKNISKKVVHSKFGKVLFIIMAIGAVIALIYYLLNIVLLA